MRPLPDAVHGKAGKARRALQHVCEVLGRNQFGAGRAVHVHKGHQEEFDVLFLEKLLRLGDVHGNGLL